MPLDACMELGPIASGTAIEAFIGRGLRLSPVAAMLSRSALPRSAPPFGGGDSSIDSHGSDHRRIPVVVVHRAGLPSAFTGAQLPSVLRVPECARSQRRDRRGQFGVLQIERALLRSSAA